MATVDSPRRLAPNELLSLPDGKVLELVDGQPLEKNVSVLSSLVGGNAYAALHAFARAQQRGTVWPNDVGLRCFADDPDKVRRPDVSFVSAERITEDVLDDTFLRVAPDLAIEVVSPNDKAYDVEEKIHDLLSAGVRLLWVIDPVRRTVRIQRRQGSAGWLTAADVLDGEDVLPGFRLPVRELFLGVVTRP